MTLTIERLHEVLNYDPATGVFTWAVNKGRRTRAGQQAGTNTTHGYVKICIDGRRYYAHRLAWFYVHGQWPARLIDHRHTSAAGDHLDNLREATPSQNQANRGIQTNNTSGAKGVTFVPSRRKWVAHIMIDRRYKFLGYFNSVKEGSVAYEAAARAAFGEYAHTG